MRIVHYTIRLWNFKMKLNHIIVCFLALFLVGCKSNSQKTKILNEETILAEQLKNTAKSIDNSLKTLAQTKEMYTPTEVLNTEPLLTDEAGLGEKINIDWSGPILPLVAKIANMSEYQVTSIGQEPSMPIIVSINKEQVTMADVLKDAGLQAGQRVTIVVYPSTKIIELRYKNF